MNVEKEKIDINENAIYKLDAELLSILLQDRTTMKNIIWATDIYEDKGNTYSSKSQMTINSITGFNSQVIKPRTKKSKKDQLIRSKEKGEVFTPSWICNEQNNLADDSWFGYSNVFNKPINKGWITQKNKIKIPSSKTWIDYVTSNILEISCGEAPYLVSRYDTVSGKIINTSERIGLLDRKIRIINENVLLEHEWKHYVEIAYKSIYGYEFQGDSLLIARENLLYTYIDYYIERFCKEPTLEEIKNIAEIISWNIFQMDGLKYVVPNSCKNETIVNLTLFGEEKQITECNGCKKNSINNHNGIYVKVKNWQTNRSVKFISLLKRK